MVDEIKGLIFKNSLYLAVDPYVAAQIIGARGVKTIRNPYFMTPPPKLLGEGCAYCAKAACNQNLHGISVEKSNA
jgi:hypothetical protein